MNVDCREKLLTVWVSELTSLLLLSRTSFNFIKNNHFSISNVKTGGGGGPFAGKAGGGGGGGPFGGGGKGGAKGGGGGLFGGAGKYIFFLFIFLYSHSTLNISSSQMSILIAVKTVP